jgi:murein L,D-transpeptidase YcbB/YkuD
MRGAGFERVLVAAAVFLALSSPGSAEWDETPSNSVEAFVPMPEPAGVPPITTADIEPQRQAPALTESKAKTVQPAAIEAVEAVRAATSRTEVVRATATAPVRETHPAVTGTVPETKVKTSSIEEAVPLPESAGLPPPTAADIGKVPFPGVGLADLPTAEKLSELLNGRLDRLVARKGDRTALQAFYSGRHFKPLWIENQAPSLRAEAAIARLKNAETDGLDPDDYATPEFKNLASPQTLAEEELKLTVAVMTFARHAQSGRVHPWRISSNIDYKLPIPDPADVLAKIAATDDVPGTLDSFNPPHAGFKALKAKLAELRKQAAPEPEVIRIPDGRTVRPGMDDPRVPLLRKRLGLANDQQSTLYDDSVFEAVKQFQEAEGINSDGMLGPNTLRALNGGVPRSVNRVDEIVSNMERWRWMPRELGKAYSMLNIPDFTLKVVRNGAMVWHTKVVVGKPVTATPIFSDEMKFITVNPVWNVPPSIIYNEYLPALDQDPSVMERMGIRVTSNDDGSIRMYQPPGDRNALGRLRFNFPNKFLVYQHDTPDKNLFDKTSRAYSHGCMRVQDPLKYAEVILSIAGPKENYTQERLRRMYGPEEININLSSPLPVHITYQTAFVDESGKLIIRDDVYGIDARVQAALKGNYLTAELTPPPEPRRDSGNPQRYRGSRDYSRYTRYGRNWYGRDPRGNFNFFDFFFQ